MMSIPVFERLVEDTVRRREAAKKEGEEDEGYGSVIGGVVGEAAESRGVRSVIKRSPEKFVEE